jgi:hypothetical protein
MLLGQRFDDRETGAELSTERRRVVTSDLQAAALFGTIRPEGRHDDGTAWFDRMAQTLDVLCAVGRLHQEMKDGPVVPHINRVNVPVGRDVSFYPPYACMRVPESGFGPRKSRRGHIQDGRTLRIAFEQPIHEVGIPASNIDDSRGRRESGCLDQTE